MAAVHPTGQEATVLTIRPIHRPTIAALACALLVAAAPVAQAQQDGGGGGAPDVGVVAHAVGHQQDLRSPDTRDAAVVNAPGGPAVDPAARPSVPGPPTWPVDPQPISPAPVVHATDSGSGLDWTTIALGIAGGLLAVGGVVAVVLHSRRLGRARIAA